MKPGEIVRTFLGIRRTLRKISRYGKGYLEIEFYDVSGTIKGYFFGGFEESKDIRRGLYAEVTALLKMHRKSLILQVSGIRVVTPEQFDTEDMFHRLSKEEMERIIAEMYPSGAGIPKPY
jgi:hypothetical protein